MLSLVRAYWSLDASVVPDYTKRRFGRFDPTVLAHARKRIGVAAETWSALAGGDRRKFTLAHDQFSLVAESLRRLHPQSAPLADALTRTVAAAVRSGETPPLALAMEVATSVLYLQAAYEELDTPGDVMAEQAEVLAARLARSVDAQSPEPLDRWMEDLYRRVSDRQTMGSVVAELRSKLVDVEQSLDKYFRNTGEKALLIALPGNLMQMRSVLSVLGLEHASQAVSHMRESVDQLLGPISPSDQERSTHFESLAGNLGALGFLIDMLGYQPALARKLFVFDPDRGELRAMMQARAAAAGGAIEASSLDGGAPPIDELVDTARSSTDDATEAALTAQASRGLKKQREFPELEPAVHESDDVNGAATFASASEFLAEPAWETNSEPDPVAVSRPTVQGPAENVEQTLADTRELLEIFLDEGREVIGHALEAIGRLREEPSNLSEQTTLRRAFHTLKGSARMVQLFPFGNAAWAMEQLFNAWLAEQKAIPVSHLQLANEALRALALWVEDIGNNQDSNWSEEPFRASADALRLGQPAIGLVLPIAPSVARLDEELAANLEAEAPTVDFQATQLAESFEDLGNPKGLQHVSITNLTPGDESIEFDWGQSISPVGNARDDDDAEYAGGEFPLSDDTHQVPASIKSPLPLDMGTLPASAEKLAVNAELDDSATPAPAHEDSTAGVWPTDLSAVDDAFTGADYLGGVVGEQNATSDGIQNDDVDLDAQAIAVALSGDFNALPASPDDSIEESWIGADEIAAIEAALADLQEAGVTENDEQPHAINAKQGETTANEFEASLDPSEDSEQAHPDVSQDEMKAIGSLRIPIPLYSVFLNEADEWSRRLVTELGEWSLELHQPLPSDAIALAHSLAGSSATVGFLDLSGLARLLERALAHVDSEGPGNRHQAGVFVDAAEDVRYLLHQFAAGFQKTPKPRILRALQSIINRETAVPSAANFLREPLSSSAAPEFLGVVKSPVEDEAGTPDAWVASDDSAAESMPCDSSMPIAGNETEAFTSQDDPVEHARGVDAARVSVLVSPCDFSADTQLSHGSRAAFDDEVDAVDAIDPELFPIFVEEALELLPALGLALRQWVQRPENTSARNEALRNLHTLKGSARLAGAMRLGELAHRLESEIDTLGRESANSAHLEPLLGYSDGLRKHLDALVARDDAANAVLAAPAMLSVPVSKLKPQEEPEVNKQRIAPDPVAAPAHPIDLAITPTHPALDGAAVPRKGVIVPSRAPITVESGRVGAGTSVRVRTQLLDRLVNQAGEVMISRSRLESRLGQLNGSLIDLSGNLDRLRGQLRDMEVQSESQMQSRLALAKDSAAGFDPLEFDRFTRVQELTRMMAESVDDVATVQRNMQRSMQGTEDELASQGRQARELQRDLLRTRMVEFESIADRLYAVARQSAKETGKPITLDITGGGIEMDRGVLERLAPVFEHLLRNAVVHGIETFADRAVSGKPATGRISVELRHAGNDVAVDFVDDGAGLDSRRIREKARVLGLPEAELPDGHPQLIDLIFASGFTTAAEVTALAGRGIGMDVVRSEVQAAGGRIETESDIGKGTRFRLILPLTTAVTQVVILRAGTLVVGVPTAVVELVRRATPAEIEQAVTTGEFSHDGTLVPFHWAGALLQVSDHSIEPVARTRPVVILKSAQQRIALHVDEVLGQQEVVVKNLGPQLARVPGLSGMSVLPSGAVVLIYNPVALANVYGEQIRKLAAFRHDPANATLADAAGGDTGIGASGGTNVGEHHIPLIMVVDDSITVRRVTQRLLRREGYRVVLASDGLQALERLQDERPAMLVSDIEMPRMDGFDLVRNIRADAKMRDLPIIMITSRTAAKHREHAMSLGANHYLGKPYPEEELMGLVRRYTVADVNAASDDPGGPEQPPSA